MNQPFTAAKRQRSRPTPSESSCLPPGAAAPAARLELGRRRADRSRKLPRLDPAGREMPISCGVALFGLRLAIRELGYPARGSEAPKQRRLVAYPPAGDLARDNPHKNVARAACPRPDAGVLLQVADFCLAGHTDRAPGHQHAPALAQRLIQAVHLEPGRAV